MNRRTFLAGLAALPVVGKYAKVDIKDAPTTKPWLSEEWRMREGRYEKRYPGTETWVQELEPGEYIPAMWREDV